MQMAKFEENVNQTAGHYEKMLAKTGQDFEPQEYASYRESGRDDSQSTVEVLPYFRWITCKAVMIRTTELPTTSLNPIAFRPASNCLKASIYSAAICLCYEWQKKPCLGITGHLGTLLLCSFDCAMQISPAKRRCLLHRHDILQANNNSVWPG
uniref:Uncharacterized protein n=1 Tax=Setaria digitata TaxID=48799 RepID=A0A915PTK1_9BILA